MCIKKVACGLQKVKREDGREVLEPIFVEIDCPDDMRRSTAKVESCKTVIPKIEHDNHGQHVGTDGIRLPNDIGLPTGKVTTDSKEVTTVNKEVTTVNKEVTTVNKEVVCIDTGEVFSSIRQASRATGIDFSNISKCCNGKLESAGGKHWKYL